MYIRGSGYLRYRQPCVCGALSPGPAGVSCDAGGGADSGACDGGGSCVDNCAGIVCDDGNECTDDPACVSVGGPTFCPPPVNNDANACTTCGGASCICDTGVCIPGCTVPAPQQAPAIPMACRNSFNQAVSTFPIDLLNITANSVDGCIHTGQAVDFDIDPVIALDTAFLEAAAQTLCDLGTFLTIADVTSAQISIDAVAGATCTEQLTTLPGVPVTVPIPTTLTCVGGTNDGGACTSGAQCPGGTCPACGSGGITEVTAGISLPLPAVNVPCTAGAVGTDRGADLLDRAGSARHLAHRSTTTSDIHGDLRGCGSRRRRHSGRLRVQHVVDHEYLPLGLKSAVS